VLRPGRPCSQELHTSNERIDEVSARLGDEDDKNTDIVDSFRDELA